MATAFPSWTAVDMSPQRSVLGYPIEVYCILRRNTNLCKWRIICAAVTKSTGTVLSRWGTRHLYNPKGAKQMYATTRSALFAPILVLMLLLPAICSAQGSEFAITIGKAFPLRNQPVILGARYQGEAADSFSVTFEQVQASGQSAKRIGTAQAEPQPDGSLWAHLEWTPDRSGFLLLRATASTAGAAFVAEKTVPVVERDMHFVWFGSGLDLQHATGITPPPKEEDLRQQWRDRGVSLLAWKGTNLDTTEKLLKYWLEHDGADGIAIDEIGAYDREPASEARAQKAFDGLAPFKKERPDAFLAVWSCGALTTPAANAYRRDADLVMLECYVNYSRRAFSTHSFSDYISQRVKMARRMDVLEKCVVGLGITSELGGITPAELRSQIEYCRLIAPECPGIAWFRYGGPERVEPEILRMADEAAVEYFIRPCLMVSDEEVQYAPGSPVNPGRLCVNIHNIGAMDATNLSVAFYDGHPDQGGRLLGKTFVPCLHAPRGWSQEYAELTAAEAKSLAYGVCEVGVPWAPDGGFHEIYVRVWAPAPVKLLQDLAHKRLRG